MLNVRPALLLMACLSAFAQDTRVILLGTGTPNPEPDRMGPSVAIVSGSHAYIVDCGPGVVRRAAQAGIKMEQITRLFVTHLHSDHTAGLPDLILTPAITGRREALELYGPPGLKAMTTHVLQAWKEDMQIRIHGLEPSVPGAYVVHAHEVKPGEIYRDEAMRVIAFAVPHGSWKYAFGYRFEAADKTIVISGDTTYSSALIAAAKGCDILIHEVYSAKGFTNRTPEWQTYHKAFDTPGPDVGRVATAVGAREVVLYHQLPMGQTPEEVLDEIRSTYTGKVSWGNDLDVIR